MTIEEVIRLATRLRTDFKCKSDTMVDFCDTIIKALEQEPVLDKIRTEIGNINLNEVATKYEDRFYGFQQEVIKIIDKYKAESEDKNGRV